MNVAVVLAGGVGSRFGKEKPKQFIEILGKPILVYTIEAFQNHNEIDAIEIVCLDSHITYMKKLVEKYQLTKVKWMTEGGINLQYSILNGICNLDGKCKEGDIVLLHLAVSPFVDAAIISDSIRVCKEKGNAVSMIPIYGASGIKDNEEKSSKWIDRSSIACMNTPMSLEYCLAKKIYREAQSNGIINAVQPLPTALMYKMGETIYFSKGSQTNNIKITVKEDLDIFESYVLMQKYKGDKNVKK